MKIAVFGATGNTGLAVLDEALGQGHELTVLVRNRSKIPDAVAPKLFRVVIGDVLNKETVKEVINGNDAVIVTLGTRNSLDATTAMSDGLKNILAAMNESGVKRVSVCISSFLFWERAKVPPQYIPITEDHERMHSTLKNDAKGLEWIAVLPPHIADIPAKGDYTVNIDKSPGRSISKYDLGNFLVKAVTSDEYVCKTVGLANV